MLAPLGCPRHPRMAERRAPNKIWRRQCHNLQTELQQTQKIPSSSPLIHLPPSQVLLNSQFPICCLLIGPVFDPCQAEWNLAGSSGWSLSADPHARSWSCHSMSKKPSEQPMCLPQVPQHPLIHPCLPPRRRSPKHQHAQMHPHPSPSCRCPASSQAPAPSVSCCSQNSLHSGACTQEHHCSNLALTNGRLAPIGKKKVMKERASLPESQGLLPTQSYFTIFSCTPIFGLYFISFLDLLTSAFATSCQGWKPWGTSGLNTLFPTSICSHPSWGLTCKPTSRTPPP